MPDLSIIIVTYNPGEILLDCLRNLPDAIGDLSNEVIVVDNASSDGFAQQAAQQYPDVKLIVDTHNTGFAGGNNLGLAAASGRYLLLLNPDVLCKPGSLAALVAFLEANPQAGLAGPRTFDREGRLSLTVHPPYEPLSILWQYLGLNRLFPNKGYGTYRRAAMVATSPFPAAWVQACCLLVRRAVYDRIGGLDEGFFLFSEDPDWCDRAHQTGWVTYFVPDAEIVHWESSAVSRYPERKVRHYHLSPLYYFRKRGRRGAVWMLKWGFTVELLLKYGIRLVGRLFGKTVGVQPRFYIAILREVWRT